MWQDQTKIENVKIGDNIGLFEGTSDWRRGTVVNKSWTGTCWAVDFYNGAEQEKHFIRNGETVEMVCEVTNASK